MRGLIISLFFKLLLASILPNFLFSYQHILAICSVFKDEAPWLKEWMEYHKMLGVTHFRLYNNESSDNYLEVLAPYIEKGDVVLLNWPNEKGDMENWALRRQWPACVDGIEKLQGIAKWVALIDIDEFILPLDDPDLLAFLEKYENVPGLVLNWQCFGTSFLEKIREGELMIESLTRKATKFSHWNLPVKSIVRPEFVDVSRRAWAPHTVFYKFGQKAIFPDGANRKETLDQTKWEIHETIAVINHYVHRTEEFFQEVKLKKKKDMKNWRLLKNQEYVKKWLLECNEDEDFRILRFAPSLRKRIFSYTAE